MIKKAQQSDLIEIMSIISETVEDLNKEGNKQWSKLYPREEHFLEDIKNHSLYVYLEEGNLAGVITLNREENKEYKDAEWQLNQQAIVIHRFAVSRRYRRRKIGTKLVQFAEHMAKEEHLDYVKVDTNSKNKKMNALFSRLDYRFCGEIYMGGLTDPFNCYDKIVK